MLFALNFKKLRSKALKVFFVYLCYITLHTIILNLLKYFDNYAAYTILLRFFNVIELGFLSYFVYLSIKNALVQKIIIVAQPLFLLYCIYDYISSKQPSIGYFPAAVECIIMLSFIIYFFFELMQEVLTVPLYLTIEFWLAVALILYFSGNFFLFVYSRTMIEDKDFKAMYIIVYGTIIIIKNTFISIAIIHKSNSGNNKRSDDYFDSRSDYFPSLDN